MFKLNQFMAVALVALGVSSAYADTTYVTNTSNSGAGSLRQAIVDANASPGLTYILYNIPGSGNHIINVPSQLPVFTQPVYVDAAPAQAGTVTLLAPTVSGPGAATVGFQFDAGSEGSYVWHTGFDNFVFSIIVKVDLLDIQYNTFVNNPGGVDVRIVPSPNKPNSVLVRLNTFTSTHAGTYAIQGSGDNVTIFGNLFDGEAVAVNNGNGVFVGGGAATSPNHFRNIGGDAVSITNVNWGTVLYNTIENIGGKGVDIHGDQITIAKNNIFNVVGYEVVVGDGSVGIIEDNTVTGDNSVLNGVIVQNANSYSIKNNVIDSASLELNNVTSGTGPFGPLQIIGNTIKNDPQGFSAHGALTLNNVTNALVSGDSIHHNASHGIYLSGSSNNTILSNEIYENGRAGVYVYTGSGNKISKTAIYYNHADAGGGKTGIVLISANNSKAAPTITSAKRVGSNFVVTGTGTISGDTVEIFKSDVQSRNSSLTQNALQYLASVKATGTTWTATFPATLSGDVYFIATATDGSNNTSQFSNARAVEINGPTAAIVGQTYTYSTVNLSGVSYSWWIAGNGTILSGQGTNQVTVSFNGTGTPVVNVAFTDPVNGWTSWQLPVTVTNSLRLASTPSSVDAEVYPNPFSGTTKVKVIGLEGEKSTLNLYDLKGELVFTSNGHYNGEEVEVGNNLTPGIYSLQIVSGNEVHMARIVKGH